MNCAHSLYPYHHPPVPILVKVEEVDGFLENVHPEKGIGFFLIERALGYSCLGRIQQLNLCSRVQSCTVQADSKICGANT